jgi:hypothetical protein
MPGNRTDADRSPTVWLPAIQRSLNVHRLEDGKAGDPDRSGGPAPRQEVRHPDAPRFQLPGDPLPLVTPLTQALQSRRSRREYMRGPLTEAQLATILLYSCGIARYVPAYGLRAFPLHFVPSQGGLHPVETYVIINRLEAWRRGGSTTTTRHLIHWTWSTREIFGIVSPDAAMSRIGFDMRMLP